MIEIIESSVRSLDQFMHLARTTKLMYFHVFDSTPNPLISELLRNADLDEKLLLLDASKDDGFLVNTPIVVDVTADRQFISKPLIELRGLGAWGRGVLIKFDANPENWEALIKYARNFIFGIASR